MATKIGSFGFPKRQFVRGNNKLKARLSRHVTCQFSRFVLKEADAPNFSIVFWLYSPF